MWPSRRLEQYMYVKIRIMQLELQTARTARLYSDAGRRESRL